MLLRTYEAQSSHFCLLLWLPLPFFPSFTDEGDIMSLSIASALMEGYAAICWGDAELSSNYFACAQGFTLPERNTDWHHCLNSLNTWKLVEYILKSFIKNSRFGGIQSAQNFFYWLLLDLSSLLLSSGRSWWSKIQHYTPTLCPNGR